MKKLSLVLLSSVAFVNACATNFSGSYIGAEISSEQGRVNPNMKKYEEFVTKPQEYKVWEFERYNIWQEGAAIKALNSGVNHNAGVGGIFAGGRVSIAPKAVLGLEVGVNTGSKTNHAVPYTSKMQIQDVDTGAEKEELITTFGGSSNVELSYKKSPALCGKVIAGYVVDDKFMPYLRLGVGTQRIKANLRANGIGNFFTVAKQTHYLEPGAGIEFVLADRVNARLDYGFRMQQCLDIDGFMRSNILHKPYTFKGESAKVRFNTHKFSTGLVYKF